MKDNNTNLIFSGGRQTGSIRGDTYYRTLKPNHFLKYPELSIAVSTDVLDQLCDRNIETLEFKHSETGTKYRCSLSHFLECGMKFNRGYGEQVRLPLTGFTVNGKNLKPAYQEERQEEKRKQLAFQGWM